MTKLSIFKCSGETGEVNLNKNISDNVNEKYKQNYSCGKNLKLHLKEYCKEAALNGVKYLGEDRTLIEKIWWAISITVALYLCIVLVWAQYIKWENSPVIVSFATRETPSWQVPFPAITLCPENKFDQSKFNFTQYLLMRRQNITLNPDIEKKFEYIAILCKQSYELESLGARSDFVGNDFFDFISEASPSFYEDIFDCKYMGERQNCSELFVPVVTDDGLCYTFNILDRSQIFKSNVVTYKNFHKTHPSNWTIENWYPDTDGQDTYPKRALFAGVPFALEAKIRITEDDFDDFCSTGTPGYKLQVAHPSRMPRVSQQNVQVPVEKMVRVVVAPDMTKTSDAVKKYNPEKRNCYFPSEGKLQLFQVYTQQNCQIECRAKFQLANCGCVDFYMPRLNSTPICSLGKLKCIKETDKRMLQSKFDTVFNKQNKSVKKICNCLPICTSMYYDLETSQADWHWRFLYPTNDSKLHMTYFQVFFKGTQFITSERNEWIGQTDFLASLGGFLGLFVGFSFLSLVEIIYFCTLRIICNIRLFGLGNWSGSNE